jgi:hypothetical protein
MERGKPSQRRGRGDQGAGRAPFFAGFLNPRKAIAELDAFRTKDSPLQVGLQQNEAFSFGEGF